MFFCAVHFKDLKSATQIMAAKRPVHQKKLGREVKGFNDNEWNQVCYDIVKNGNMAKVKSRIDPDEVFIVDAKYRLELLCPNH